METAFSDEYDLVVPTGDVTNKQQLIGIYKSGDMKQKTLEVENLQVRVYEDMATARGLYRSEFKYKGQQMKQTSLRTDFFVKRAGKLQIVLVKRRSQLKSMADFLR
jgi:Domain of unknown function (DUF4440)